MSRFQTNLRIPGPTSLPDAVREAGARQMINHRGPEFAQMLDRVTRRLQAFFRTSNSIQILTSSGSGGLEAGIVNTLSPGDPVLVVSIGSFGDRVAKIATAYGADVRVLSVEWGNAADPADVQAALRERPETVAVLMTHNETSTAIANPVRELAAAIRETSPDALIMVDEVSGLGAIPFDTDAWELDIVVTGSQKAWMTAPGLAMVALSDRAWAANATARMPRFYFDLAAHRDFAARGETPWTPAVSVIYQLDVALGLLEREGAEAIVRRHAACAAATRAGLTALGFVLYGDPRFASPTVTAAWVPDGLDWKAFNAALLDKQLVLAGGQGKLAGKVFRVGHLGSVTLDEILAMFGIIEETLDEFGRPVELGSGVAAAQRAGIAVLQGRQAELAAV